MLDPNRLFPSDPAARSVAQKLYQTVRDLPIISPHGHTDPRWFAENKPFPNPAALLIQPDHYIFRMLYSQGVPLEALGVPQTGTEGDPGAIQPDPQDVWRIFARHYYLFRGTPTRLWLDYTLEQEFGLTERLCEGNADEFYQTIDRKLQTPEFLPRSLFERFKIAVLATTDAAFDTLEYHKAIRASGWNGRVVPTFRPDAVVDAEYTGFQDNLKRLAESANEDVSTWKGYLNALRTRRAFLSRTAPPQPTTATSPR